MPCFHIEGVECFNCRGVKEQVQPDFETPNISVDYINNMTFEQGQKIIEILRQIEKLLEVKR